MGWVIGQVQVLSKHLSLDQVQAALRADMTRAGETWEMDYWRDGKDRPCAVRIDGLNAGQVAMLKAAQRNLTRTFYGREVERFAPLEWDLMQLPAKRWDRNAPTIAGRRKWDQMEIGQSQVMQNRREIRRSLMRCCVPRNCPFGFELWRRRDLENPAKPEVQWFQVTRIA